MTQSKEHLEHALRAFSRILAERGAEPEDIGRLIPAGLNGDPEALLAARRRAGPRALLNHLAYRLERAKRDLAEGQLEQAKINIHWLSGAIYVLDVFPGLEVVVPSNGHSAS